MNENTILSTAGVLFFAYLGRGNQGMYVTQVLLPLIRNLLVFGFGDSESPQKNITPQYVY
ncbi:MAG: hypothetical protein A6F71_10680 [Cycloclasticus sp. symbiont of Poecilosclerida sp. M]|nr:MAG: hypothetical protein A6F71_10680 [Cycloclasticus sp. symbiont of Poecilosclerida sp. M]